MGMQVRECAHTDWQKIGRRVQLSKWLSYFFTSIFFDPSSTVRLLSATVLSLALPVNHECMKQSRSSQVNVLWLSYHGNAGSNSQGDAVLRILPGTRNHTHTERQNVSLLLLQWKHDRILFACCLTFDLLNFTLLKGNVLQISSELLCCFISPWRTTIF